MAIKSLDTETSGSYEPRKLRVAVKTAKTAEDLAAEKSFSDTANAVGQAGTMVGQTIDPKGEGAGSAIAGAATGAAIGTTVGGPVGTAIGAAIGLGLGVIQGEQKRKENEASREAKGLEIMAKGLKDASDKMTNIRFRFGTKSGSFGSGRNLK